MNIQQRIGLCLFLSFCTVHFFVKPFFGTMVDELECKRAFVSEVCGKDYIVSSYALEAVLTTLVICGIGYLLHKKAQK